MTRRDWIHGWLPVLPAMVPLALFTHLPAITTIRNSFFSTPRGRRPSRFVGLENHDRLVSDPTF